MDSNRASDFGAADGVPGGTADVVILGGGPAGCAAAISALSYGLRVILVERRATPVERPGETLHAGLEPIFRKLGVWDTVLACGFPRHRGIWRENLSGDRLFEPYGRDADGAWHGLLADRAQLDEILRQRVAALGGCIIFGTQPSRVLFHGEHPVGLEIDGRTIRAPFLLDATGRRPWLASQLALIPENLPPHQRLRFGWHPTVPEELDALDGQPIFRERADGWAWQCPLGDGRCAWVELHHDPEALGLDYAPSIYRSCAGPGYFLLGDAACLLDPSLGNGVLRALMSGIYAAHLIAAVRCGQATKESAAHEYRRWIGELFDKSAKARFGAATAEVEVTGNRQ